MLHCVAKLNVYEHLLSTKIEMLKLLNNCNWNATWMYAICCGWWPHFDSASSSTYFVLLVVFFSSWFDKPLSMKPANYQERLKQIQPTGWIIYMLLNDLTLHQNDDIVFFRYFFGSSWNLKHQSHSSYSGSFVICTCYFLRIFPLFPLFAQCNNKISVYILLHLLSNA